MSQEIINAAFALLMLNVTPTKKGTQSKTGSPPKIARKPRSPPRDPNTIPKRLVKQLFPKKRLEINSFPEVPKRRK